jgi:thiamine-phosphate diphosphorylase
LTLCFITNRRLYGDDERIARVRVLEAIGAAAAAGVDLIQIRERDLEGAALADLVRQAVASVRGTNARVLVNDRGDVAIAAGAHGVHLRGDSVPAPRLRAVAPSLILGRSVHGVDEAVAAAAAGACDYLLAGTVLPTPSKPAEHALLGIEGLRRVCAAVPLPVVAVGGIGIDEAPDVARAGAAGIAGIRLFADAATVAATVRRLRRMFDTDPEVV